MKTYNVCFAKKYFLILLIMFLDLSSAFGQNKPKLSILLETLDNEAIQCGITDQSVLTPAILTLRNYGVEYSTTDTSPKLYIQLVAIKAPYNCFFGINLEIYITQNAFNRNGIKSLVYENVQLCSDKSIGTSSFNTIQNQIFLSIERATKNCLAKVQY